MSHAIIYCTLQLTGNLYQLWVWESTQVFGTGEWGPVGVAIAFRPMTLNASQNCIWLVFNA